MQLIKALYAAQMATQQNYAGIDFCRAHPQIQFNTLEKGRARLQLSCYDLGITPQYGDELLTLSTCSYHAVDGRFVVPHRIAKKTQPDVAVLESRKSQTFLRKSVTPQKALGFYQKLSIPLRCEVRSPMRMSSEIAISYVLPQRRRHSVRLYRCMEVFQHPDTSTSF